MNPVKKYAESASKPQVLPRWSVEYTGTKPAVPRVIRRYIATAATAEKAIQMTRSLFTKDTGASVIVIDTQEVIS